MPRCDVQPGNAPCIMQADDCCISNKSSHVTNPFMAAHRSRACGGRARTWSARRHRGARRVERYDNWRHEARWRLSFVFLGPVCIWPPLGFPFPIPLPFLFPDSRPAIGHRTSGTAGDGSRSGIKSICGTANEVELGMLLSGINLVWV